MFKSHELMMCFFELWRRLGVPASEIYFSFWTDEDFASVCVGPPNSATFIADVDCPRGDALNEKELLGVISTRMKTAARVAGAPERIKDTDPLGKELGALWVRFLETQAYTAVRDMMDAAAKTLMSVKHDRPLPFVRRLRFDLRGGLHPTSLLMFQPRQRADGMLQ